MSLSTNQQILVEQRLANDKKSTLIAYLLWFFLGSFAAHRFYFGMTGSAVGMLILSISGWLFIAVIIGIPLLFAFLVWWVVDAFMIPGFVERHTQEMRSRITRELSSMSGAN